jgi:hypothetical protein
VSIYARLLYVCAADDTSLAKIFVVGLTHWVELAPGQRNVTFSVAEEVNTVSFQPVQSEVTAYVVVDGTELEVYGEAVGVRVLGAITVVTVEVVASALQLSTFYWITFVKQSESFEHRVCFFFLCMYLLACVIHNSSMRRPSD